MTKGTIVYVGNFDKPTNNAPGKLVYGNAQLLKSLGYDVLLIGKTKESTTEEECVFDSIVFKSFPQFGMINTQKYLKWFDQYLSNKHINPILIIRYGSPSLALFEYQLHLWCRRKRIPLVTNVVDWLKADGNSIFFNVIKTVDTVLSKRIFNKKGNGIIAISSFLFDYYRCFGENRIILPPLVDHYAEPVKSIDEIHICYAGQPFRKGIIVKDTSKIKDRLDLAVLGLGNVVKVHDDVFFHIYGITKDEYLFAFPTHKKILDETTNRILFYGYTPMEKIQHVISTMDYTILLRDRNRASMAGFPSKVVESVSCCTPVITTRTSDLEKYIQDGRNGFFVDISSLDKLTSDLKRVVSLNKEEKHQMKIRLWEEKSFYYQRFRDSMTSFLQNVMSKKD